MYDRVLLQIDSTRDGNSSIIWGDLGIANILVKSTDLEAMKFDDYMYSWIAAKRIIKIYYFNKCSIYRSI